MSDKNPYAYLFSTNSSKKWKSISLKRRSGALIPLFSIYSKSSIGIGDLSDLRLLVDWIKSCGNSVIQLLPMNEVGAVFCPYDSISAFALEPAYISLREIPGGAGTKGMASAIEDLAARFPTGKTYIDYGIKAEKMRLLWEIFFKSGKESAEFKKFREDNVYWLTDFALYKVIKELSDGRPWYDWDQKYRDREKKALSDFAKENQKALSFHMWVQWQLFKQFKEAKDYAASKGVLLKGDLPILVSRDSADVWQHPEFFKLEYAAGAPADMYCAKGQRWGMPTNNWERIKSDGSRYLIEKLKYAQNFYDILRIDHVVGLFRIWSIAYNEPLENQGLYGFFDPADEGCWGEHGRGILFAMLNNTAMLLCAEDLGIIPQVCTQTLRELGIPGNDVQRWVKDWKVRHDFLRPEEYRELSVSMLSTHDTTNWPAWWEYEAGTVDEALFARKCGERGIDCPKVKSELFDPDLSRYGRLRWKNGIDPADKLVSFLGKRKDELADFIDIYENTYLEKEKLWKQLGLSGLMREKSDKEIVKSVMKIALDSDAIFCINTIFDWLYLADILSADPYQYRINTPGSISPKNWSLTIPLPLEELIKHKVTKDIRSIVSSSGRA